MKLFGLHLIRSAPLTPVSDNRGGWWPLVREPFTGAWQRNREIRTDSILAHHAVYSCITRIAQDIGKLRPKLVEQDDTTRIWTETDSPAFSGVLRRPNRFQNHIQFKEWWITSKLIHGNAYALKQRDGRGVVEAIYVLDPTRVKVLVAPDGSVFYELKSDNLSSNLSSGSNLELPQVVVPSSEIVHDRMNCLFHPLVGTSPIFACGVAADMGLTIQNNSTSFFGAGSNQSGILSSPANITPDKAEKLSQIWNSQFGGGNAGRVAVLGDGMKFEAMRMSAVDSQLIDQLKWSSETVCATYHVPAWKVGVGEQPAYTKPEIANQAYYSDCLQAHIESFELAMDEMFGFETPTEGRWLGVELDLDGLLRMDMASQVTTLTEAVRGSLLTVNDARKRLSEQPVAGGDSIWMQQQNYSLEALAERDRNDPFAKQETVVTAQIAEGEAQKALPAGELEKEERAAPDLEEWNGWFARDELTLVREAREMQTRAVEAPQPCPAKPDPAIMSLTSAVLALAGREIPAPIVNVGSPIIQLPKPGNKEMKLIRNELGAVTSVETTET